MTSKKGVCRRDRPVVPRPERLLPHPADRLRVGPPGATLGRAARSAPGSAGQRRRGARALWPGGTAARLRDPAQGRGALRRGGPPGLRSPFGRGVPHPAGAPVRGRAGQLFGPSQPGRQGRHPSVGGERRPLLLPPRLQPRTQPDRTRVAAGQVPRHPRAQPPDRHRPPSRRRIRPGRPRPPPRPTNDQLTSTCLVRHASLHVPHDIPMPRRPSGGLRSYGGR